MAIWFLKDWVVQKYKEWEQSGYVFVDLSTHHSGMVKQTDRAFLQNFIHPSPRLSTLQDFSWASYHGTQMHRTGSPKNE